MANNEVKAVFVLGLKWFDKVNGNTYCRPVVFCDNGTWFTDDYEYGYGTYYMTMAERLCKEFNVVFDTPAHADKMVKKAELRNKNYY